LHTLNAFWGYHTGEEHITEEQFAQIDFGNPSIDEEFITFDPLASSYFQGKYYRLVEKKIAVPHRTLPSMTSQTLILYEETDIKISDPLVELDVPVGILLCLIYGEQKNVSKAIDFLERKINLRLTPCDIDFKKFIKIINKTRLKFIPHSLTISDLRLEDGITGDLKVYTNDNEMFLDHLEKYHAKIASITFDIHEINLYINATLSIYGQIKLNKDIYDFNIMQTLSNVLSRSVTTG
jgi:hypothetical protein